MNYQFPKPFTLLFLSGASGSGTTLLTKLLSTPKNVLSITGKHRTVPQEDAVAFQLARKLNALTTRLWGREVPYQQYQIASEDLPHIVGRFLEFPQYAHVTHLMMKRSAPFHEGDSHRPDFDDLVNRFPTLKIIVTYRDPRASTYSTFRRDFVDNLRYAAVVCDDMLTYLSAQLSTLPREMFRVLPYEDFCQRPHYYVPKLASFCDLPEDVLRDAVEAEKIDPNKNELWQASLSLEEKEFLNHFFNPRRHKQWQFLSEAAQEW